MSGLRAMRGLRGLYDTLTRRQRAHNLLLWSEQFDNAYWTKSGATVTPDATASVGGGPTADKLVENTTNGGHYIERDVAVTASNTYTVTWHIKAAERFRVNLENYSIPTTTILANIQFNTQTGAFSSQITQGGAQFLSTTAEAFADGWWRVRLTILMGGSNTSVRARAAMIGPNSSTVYTGDGTSGIFIWGAQLNQGDLQPYRPTFGTAV